MGIFNRIVRYLAYTAAAAVMLLALLVGLVRLLLPVVPEYQEDIRAWATQMTGLDVRFRQISASWPIAGPEIQFLDVTAVSPEDGRPVFVADRLDIGISVSRLLRDRELTVSRIGVAQTSVDLGRDEHGAWFVQGRPLAGLLPQRPPGQPLRLPHIDIELRDVGVQLHDALLGAETLALDVEEMKLHITPAAVELNGEVGLPAAFGEHASLSADLPAGVVGGLLGDGAVHESAQTGTLYARGEKLHLARIAGYVLNMPTPIVRMNGDVTLWVRLAGAVPTAVTTEVELADIALRTGAATPAVYDAIDGRFEWARDASGWLVSGSRIKLLRAGQTAPANDFTVSWRPDTQAGGGHWQASAGFVRLQDWFPFVRALAGGEVRDRMLPSALRGDISDLRLDLRTHAHAAPDFGLEMRFEDAGVTGLPGGEAWAGASGSIAADADGGRIELDSGPASLTMPKLFVAPLAVDTLRGLFVWRVTADGVRILSDNVRISTPFARADSRLELTFPRDGRSPRLDLTARASATDGARVVDFLPLRRFPAKVGDWLHRAIVSGRVTDADVEVRGPLRRFPFPDGDGVFHIAVDVADGILDYAPDWPRLENLSGRIVFDGVSLTTTDNRADYGGIPVANANVRIADLRKGLLQISGPQTATAQQALAFLRASPVAAAIGPTLDRVRATGTLDADFELLMPVTRPQDYELQIDVETAGATVDLERLDFGLTEITGSLSVSNTVFYADDLRANLLGEPVTIDMRPAGADLYTQYVTLHGRTPVRKWFDVLHLPRAEDFSGAATWQAMLMFPARRAEGAGAPLHVLVRSDLVGVESRVPAPANKPAGVPRAFEADIAFPSDDLLEVSGHLGAALNWALQLEATPDGWRIERGGVHAGSAAALLPLEPGIEISGYAPFIRFDDWYAMAGGDGTDTAEDTGDDAWKDLYRSAELRIDRFAMLGQVFPDTRIDAQRRNDIWRIAVDGPNLAGTITLPMQPDNDDPARLKLSRLWLLDSDEVSGAGNNNDDGDPRAVIPFELQADDFIINKLKFGSLQATATSTPSGVVVDPVAMRGDSFTINGNAAWLVHPNDDMLQQSRLTLDLSGTDVKAVLQSFGYHPVIEGESITASADLTWSGGPDGDFLYRADGNFSIAMKDGAVLSLEPGGGRLLGVLSVTALPRRLSLDFRDVTDDGLGFDTLQGDFMIDAGNAYTCNLGLEGSVADMGIVGRTGLATEDYDQLAVVRPHVSNLFALGGAVVGGPAAGAAVLLFSQIFRKPLSQLGESYYRITGSWDSPDIKRLQASEVNITPLKNCQAYIDNALRATAP